MSVDDDDNYDNEKGKRSDEVDNEGCVLMMMCIMIIRYNAVCSCSCSCM